RGGQAAHVLAQQRVMVHRVAEPHRVLDLLSHQLEPLQGRLPATQVQGSQDLVVRGGGGVRHVGLVRGSRRSSCSTSSRSRNRVSGLEEAASLWRERYVNRTSTGPAVAPASGGHSHHPAT